MGKLKTNGSDDNMENINLKINYNFFTDMYD